MPTDQTDLFCGGAIRIAKSEKIPANQAFTKVCELNGLDPGYAPLRLGIIVQAVYDER